LPAMKVNDDAWSLTPCGVLRFFASKLAPTELTGLPTAQNLVHGSLPAQQEFERTVNLKLQNIPLIYAIQR
jgi:hypothetical protein